MTPETIQPSWDHRTFSTRRVTTIPTMRFHHTAPGRTVHHAMPGWPIQESVATLPVSSGGRTIRLG